MYNYIHSNAAVSGHAHAVRSVIIMAQVCVQAVASPFQLCVSPHTKNASRGDHFFQPER
jgi:hypothetical protein